MHAPTPWSLIETSMPPARLIVQASDGSIVIEKVHNKLFEEGRERDRQNLKYLVDAANACVGDPEGMIKPGALRERELALQSLTPGGSEYVNNPAACVAYVKELRLSHFKHVKQRIVEQQNLRALIGDLWHFIEDVADDDPDRTSKFFALRERIRNLNPKGLP